MIQPSLCLRRALLADAIFSSVSALFLSLGAWPFVNLLDLPEMLLRGTGLFLIAYAVLVGWLATRQATARGSAFIVIAGNAPLGGREHRASIRCRGQSRRVRRNRHRADRPL